MSQAEFFPRPDLKDSRGFLPKFDPSEILPENYWFLDDLADMLPQLLHQKKLRSVLNHLRIVNSEGLEDMDRYRALMIYSFLANAYVHNIGEPAIDKIPAGIAIPLYELTNKLDKNHPIMSYDSYVLYNWRKIDQNGGMKIENLQTLMTFSGRPDEEGFIVVHLEIEDKAREAIKVMRPVQLAIKRKDKNQLEEYFLTIHKSNSQIVETLKKMDEVNSPEVYYRYNRPYLKFFTNVIYEGVEEYKGKPQSFIGETGAQSSIMPSLDILFSIRHRPTPLTNHVLTMREYMPRSHREFLEELENGYNVRKFVKVSKDKNLKDLYNGCLSKMVEFRNQHLKWADVYINKKEADQYGTGGTQYMEWLAQLRDETIEAML